MSKFGRRRLCQGQSNVCTDRSQHDGPIMSSSPGKPIQLHHSTQSTLTMIIEQNCQCCFGYSNENAHSTRSYRTLLSPAFSQTRHWSHLFKSKPISYCWMADMLVIAILLFGCILVKCDSTLRTDSGTLSYSGLINGLSGESPKLNRSLKLMDVQKRTPPINHLKFCGDPPLVPHAQSNLKRNQKHYVFPVGQEASYMCDQGYIALGGTAVTRCSVDNQVFAHSSHVIFPDSVHFDHRPQVSLLGSGRSKNSKRLMSDIDEEPDMNANGHRSILFPTIQDKRKMSRKSDEDLIGPLYDAHPDARSSDLDGDNVDYIDKSRKLDKTSTSYYELNNQAARWWPPVTLNCQLVNCSDPGHVPNSIRKDPQGGFSFNTNVFFECEQGYETIGIPILTCRSNGTWNRSPPKCRFKQCPPLPLLKNGKILYSDTDRRADSRAEYYCNTGFRLNAHSNTRHCRENDQWTSLEPLIFVPGNTTNSTFNDPYSCIPVECPTPIRPHSGLRILSINRKQRVNKYLPGDVIIYSCSANNIKATAKCHPDGDWSRGPPHCPSSTPNPLRCPALTTLSHGSVKIEQSKATFSCSNGYELDGSGSITCNSNGVWSDPVPRCVLLMNPPSNSITDDHLNLNNHMSNSLEKNEQLLEQQQKNTSATLTILLTIIGVVVGLIMISGAALFCRWRQQQLQRKRWQQYFGHYHHRQSKTNIVLSSTYNGNAITGNGASTATPLGVSSNAQSSTGVAATKHLLQRQPNCKSTSSNNLQSSFSSSDENAPKSFNTGTISSDHGRTVSTYADDTSPEDDDDDEDIYSNASILPNTERATVFSANARQHHSLPAPESKPMMLLSNSIGDHSVAKRTLSTGTDQHLYSNLPNSIPLSPMPMNGVKPSTEANRLSNVPVTDL